MKLHDDNLLQEADLIIQMGIKNKSYIAWGPYFHKRVPIITVKIGTWDPQISGKMGTRVSIILVEWGPGVL